MDTSTRPAGAMDPKQRENRYLLFQLLLGFGMMWGLLALADGVGDLSWPLTADGMLVLALYGVGIGLAELCMGALLLVFRTRKGWGLGVGLSVLMLLGLYTLPVGIFGLWALLSKGGRAGFEGKLDGPAHPPELDEPTQILRALPADEAPTERFYAGRHEALLESSPEPKGPDWLDRAAVAVVVIHAGLLGIFAPLGVVVWFLFEQAPELQLPVGIPVALTLGGVGGLVLYGALALGMSRRKGWAWVAGLLLLLPLLLGGDLLLAVPLVHLLRPKGRKEYGVSWQAPVWFDHALS